MDAPTAHLHQRTTVRVRYAETDQMGVVYHANYLVWFEVGRTDWLRLHGLTYRDLEASGTLLAVIELHCEFREPARYDDEVGIEARASLASPARLRFDYQARRVRDGVLLAEGFTVHAAVDRLGHPRRIPAAIGAMVASRSAMQTGPHRALSAEEVP